MAATQHWYWVRAQVAVATEVSSVNTAAQVMPLSMQAVYHVRDVAEILLPIGLLWAIVSPVPGYLWEAAGQEVLEDLVGGEQVVVVVVQLHLEIMADQVA